MFKVAAIVQQIMTKLNGAVTEEQKIQGAAERTPRFGRGIASGGERVQWWRALRRTAVYVQFSVYTMAWSGEHRAFIVEEFIKMADRR